MPEEISVSRRKLLGATASGLAGVAASSGTAAAHETYEPYWTTTDVNLRTGPSLNNSVKRTVAVYTGLQLRDGPWYNDGYEWWYVRADGDRYNSGRTSGYMVADYMNFTTFAHPCYGELISDHDDSRSHGSHDAIDIYNGVGHPVYPARAGTAYNYNQGQGVGCGKYVKVFHDNGWESLYCHLDDYYYVSDGTWVDRGTQIGTVGYSGNASPDLPHLHFQIKDGNGNPVSWPTTKHVDLWRYTAISGNF